MGMDEWAEEYHRLKEENADLRAELAAMTDRRDRAMLATEEAEKRLAEKKKDSDLLLGLLESIYAKLAVNCSPDIHKTLMEVIEEIRAAIDGARKS